MTRHRRQRLLDVQAALDPTHAIVASNVVQDLPQLREAITRLLDADLVD